MEHILEKLNPYIIFCKSVTRENCPPAGTVYRKRKVKWYELEFIVDGSGYIDTDGAKIPAESGTLFFRRPGSIVQGVLPYYGYMVIFDMFYDESKTELYRDPDFRGYREILINPDKAAESEAILPLPGSISGLKLADYETLFAAIFEQYTLSERDNQLYLKAALLEIVVKLMKDYELLRAVQNPGRSLKTNYHKIIKVKNYILDNVSTRFSLTDLARIGDLSPNFLCKLFKDVMGVNLFDYINMQKINLAKRLLIDTNKNVKDVYIKCGFDNESYFYRLFKKSVGKSPLDFREDYKKLNSTLLLDQIDSSLQK